MSGAHAERMHGNELELSELSPCRENIAAVTVSYHPDSGFLARVRRVLPQVQRVIVVDNSGSAEIAQVLKEVEALGGECIRNSSNVGLASALNTGIQRAIDLEMSFVLTLDQDTMVDEEMILSLTRVWRGHPNRDRIAILGSNARSPISGRLAIRRPAGAEPFTEEKSVVTSGSLISLSAYKQLGAMRSDFFIEGIDSEYCLRAIVHGFKVLSTREPLMTHAAGKQDERRIFGRIVQVAHHEPWRYYYQVRNSICIARRYLAEEPAFVASMGLGFAKTFVKTLLFEKKRLRKLGSVLLGIKDGFLLPVGGQGTTEREPSSSHV